MRPALRLAGAGLLGTTSLLVLLTPERQDPLRFTVALLPLLVAGFAALRAAGESRESGRGARLGMLAAVGSWALLASGWRHLTFQYAEPVVAAAGVLLLVGWLAGQLPDLLRRLARSGDALPPRVFFLLPLLVYISVLPWVQSRYLPNGDEPYYLLVAHSIAYDGDIDLTNNYANDDALAFMPRRIEPQDGDPRGEAGEIYSRHAPAAPLLLALPYRLGGETGAALLMLALAAGTAWAALALARELHPRRHRGQLLAWAILAFASPLSSYSYRFWGEVPAALCLALAAVLMLRRRGARRPTTGFFLAIAVLLAYPVLIKLRFGLVAAPLGALAWWWTGRRWRPAAAVAAALLAAGAAVLSLNLAQFDQVLGTHTLRALDLFRYSAGTWVSGAAGLFLDTAFGLAASSPLWLLLPPAVVLTVRRSPASRWLLLAWLPYFLVLLPRSNAFNQFAPPFRYALAILPLLAACLVPALEDRRTSVRALTRVLGVVSVILAIVWITQPEWTVNRSTGTNHLIDRLAILTHSDLGRLFPSYIRLRAAAWVWAAAILAVAACWRWWPRRLRLRGLPVPVLLLAVAGTAWSAAHAPSRTVELEDRWVEHAGGEEYPGTWDPWGQPRAWKLAPGDELRIPVVPGGPILRPTVRLRNFRGVKRQVALELLADDGRVHEYWTADLEPGPPWQWEQLPSIALPAERPFELTLRAVEPVRGDAVPLAVWVHRVRGASDVMGISIRTSDKALARWKGTPDPARWMRVPVRRLRWREGALHPLVRIPDRALRSTQRGSPVVLRFRFDPTGTVLAVLRAGGQRRGAWSATAPRRGWKRLEARGSAAPEVWRLPRRSHDVILDRARFDWSTPPASGDAADAPAPDRASSR